MQIQTPKERALDMLRNHFWGIGEEHPDFKEGMKAVNCLEELLKTLDELLAFNPEKTGGRN
tara:strand:+ start:2300 stop:2482 length:183 start_codon:yes stop_codon:yes gene_type:complete